MEEETESLFRKWKEALRGDWKEAQALTEMKNANQEKLTESSIPNWIRSAISRGPLDKVRTVQFDLPSCSDHNCMNISSTFEESERYRAPTTSGANTTSTNTNYSGCTGHITRCRCITAQEIFQTPKIKDGAELLDLAENREI